MYKIIIKKGRHRPFLQMPGLYIDKKRFTYKLRLDHSWKYELPKEDQADICKIVGIGYLPWWKMVLVFFSSLFFLTWRKFHHEYSWRLGVNFNPETNENKTFVYVYDKSKRYILPLAPVQRMLDYTLVVDVYPDYYLFQLWGSNVLIGVQTCPKTHNYKIAIRLGTYFGGNQKAPHDIITYLKPIQRWIGQLSFYYL